MARGQSPYQGRYTVPIADFSGIERAGAAWGDAFKGIGEQVEKYQLNKKKRTVLEDSLQGKIEALMEHDPRAAEALFRDESFDKDTQRLATGEMKLSELEGLVGKIDGYSGQTQNIMRDKLAASQAKIAQVDARIAERDKAQMSQFAKTLAELQVERVTDTNQAEIDRLNALAESVGLDRDILKRTVDDRVSILQSQAKTAEAGAAGAKLKYSVNKAIVEGIGGPEQYADFKLQIEQSQLDSANSMNSYRDMMGLASYYNSVAKMNPSFESQLSPISAALNKLQSDKVIPITTEGGKKHVSLDEFVKLREADEDFAKRHPWTGAAASQAGAVANQTRKMQQLLDSQQVRAITPETGEIEPSPISVMGGKSIQDMTVSEAAEKIPELEAQKQKLIHERNNIKTVGRSAERQVPSFSTWGGPQYESVRVEGEREMTVRESTERNQRIDAELESIDEMINQINDLLKTP